MPRINSTAALKFGDKGTIRAMTLANRFIGPIARLDDANRDLAHVDVGMLVRRLLLLHTNYVESIRLLELPALIRAFGIRGAIELFESGALLIYCDAVVTAEVGRTDLLSRRGKAPLPLWSYAFTRARIADHKAYIHGCLDVIEKMEGLNDRDRRELRSAVGRRVMDPVPDAGIETIKQLTSDLASNSPIVKAAVAFLVSQKVENGVRPEDFDLVVHQLDQTDFRVETNLADKAHLEDKEGHDLIAAALLGIGGLNQRLEFMSHFNAMCGLRQDDIPLLDEKLGLLAHAIAPDAPHEQWRRVLQLADLPDIPAVPEASAIDIGRVLKIRDSNECRTFRDWLASTEDMTDAAIAEHLGGVRARLQALTNSKVGKTVRFVATTALALGNAGAGVVGSAIDTFAINKLLGKGGPAVFLEDYPSIFSRPVAPPEQNRQFDQ